MEPQPGSPASPPSPGTPPSPGSARAVTAPDEPTEEATEQEPGRKSTSSSSSSSSSESSAGSPRHVDVVELGDTLLPAAPEDDEQFAVASSIQSGEGEPDGSATVGDEHAEPPVQGAGGKPGDCAAPEDEHAAALKHSAEVEPDDRALPEDGQAAAPAVRGAEVKPDDWAAWPEPPPPAVEYSSSSDGSAGAAPTEAPQVQTMGKLGGAGAATGEFDPQRIPASVFQTRASMSQAEWSMTSNESLFSIQGASDVGGPYASSRSHFDFFYDEAMAAAEAESKLPSVEEGMESAEFAAPGSASSRASGGSPDAKKATVFRRHDSSSGDSSSNFSFAFPILAPTSPKKKDLVGSALFQPLEKGYDQQPPEREPPASAFVEMTTEAERRHNTGGCCCCGCCWFDCSWDTWCGWWRCCGSCSCPSFCRRSWCPCS